MLPHISLEQWATLVAVVEEGTFAKAAERLNKSQSSVSYTLSKMEQQLPLAAFEQQGRRAELTEAGKLLYRHATNLLSQASQIENIAHYLARGWETEITLAVDSLVPINKVFCALHQFSSEHPQPRVNVLETTLSGTDEAILFRRADIVLSPNIITGFTGSALGTAQLRYVVSPDHPLAKLNRPVYEDDLKQYRHIVIKDSGQKRQRDAGWLGAEQRWSVSHISSSIEATKAGLGFANLPLDGIEQELQRGELIRLEMGFETARDIPLYLIKTAQTETGPAVTALSSKLLLRFRNNSD